MPKVYLDKNTKLETDGAGIIDYQIINKILCGIYGSTGEEIASANNLTMATSNIIKVTGTTTVNLLLKPSTSEVIPSHAYLILESGITIKHRQADDTGRISLKGSIDFTTGDVTILHLVSFPAYLNGYEWFEVSRCEL